MMSRNPVPPYVKNDYLSLHGLAGSGAATRVIRLSKQYITLDNSHGVTPPSVHTYTRSDPSSCLCPLYLPPSHLLRRPCTDPRANAQDISCLTHKQQTKVQPNSPWISSTSASFSVLLVATLGTISSASFQHGVPNQVVVLTKIEIKQLNRPTPRYDLNENTTNINQETR